MFITNKYSKLYYSLIERAINLKLGKGPGRERHHIIPQSLGGTNIKSNLVYISAREHFICHWLLIKMTEGEARSKMLYALHGMRAENRFQTRYHTKITSRVYAKYRFEQATNHSKTMKGKPAPNKGVAMSEEQKQKLRIAATGKKYSAETIAKRSATIRGIKRSAETRLKMSLAAKGVPKGPHSKAHNLAISLASKGVKKSKDHSANVRAAVLGNLSINLNGEEKKVKKDVLQSWLDRGWKLGGKLRLRNKESK